MDDIDEFTHDPLFDIPEYRFTEFRAVEGRTIFGIAVDYSDTSLRPGGMQERFDVGAFGDVDALDTILHWQHERASPLARTTRRRIASPYGLCGAVGSCGNTCLKQEMVNDALLLGTKGNPTRIQHGI